MTAPDPEATRIILRPRAVDDAGFTIEETPDGAFVVSGAQPERWVRQTNFDNDEAVGYLADRLNRLGVEEKLAKAGAVQGSLVRIGDREFDWEPTLGDGHRPDRRPAWHRPADHRALDPAARVGPARRPQGAPRADARPARLRQRLRHESDEATTSRNRPETGPR